MNDRLISRSMVPPRGRRGKPFGESENVAQRTARLAVARREPQDPHDPPAARERDNDHPAEADALGGERGPDADRLPALGPRE
ncbi:MAG TPA: hypothetical protein VI006_17725, partial [Solirubrobacteraceae bacterium]